MGFNNLAAALILCYEGFLKSIQPTKPVLTKSQACSSRKMDIFAITYDSLGLHRKKADPAAKGEA